MIPLLDLGDLSWLLVRAGYRLPKPGCVTPDVKQLSLCPYCGHPVPGLLAGCDRDDCRTKQHAEDAAHTRSQDL